MSVKIIFYAEAFELQSLKKSAGLGHLFRLYPVFKVLRDKINNVEFYSSISSSRLKNLGITDIMPIDSSEIAFNNILQVNKPDIIIFDGYDVVKSIISMLVSENYLKVILFDDRYTLDNTVDTVINTALNATPSKYKAKIAKAILCGTKYSPIVSEFLVARQTFRVRKSINRILLALGGNDAMGNIERTITALTSLIPDSITVDVIGENVPENLSPSLSFNYVGWKAPIDLAVVSSEYDLAILAGGSMLHQFSCVGVPILCWPQTFNQYKHARVWQQYKAITLVETLDDLPLAFKQMKSYCFRKKLSSNSRMLVDGLGAERIAAHILEAL